MPIQNKAGTPAIRNFDPKGRRGSANAQGLYPTSVFVAALCKFAPKSGGGDYIISESGLQGKQIQLLLFTTDLPLVCRAHIQSNNDSGLFNPQQCQNLLTTSANFVTAAPSGSSAPTLSNYGQVLKGYSGGAYDVPVSGFPARIYNTIKAPLSGFVAGGQVIASGADIIFVECIASAGSVAGVIGSLYQSLLTPVAGTIAPKPILLKYNAYSAEMRAAGNLFTDDDGDLYQVVGLYYIFP